MDRRQELVELVTLEATNLRDRLTHEEKKRLNKDTFSPSEYNNCIYGQITGHCFSQRAQDLIEECCPRVYEAWSADDMKDSELNGSPKGLERAMHSNKYWSPIEVYIVQDDEENTVQDFYDMKSEDDDADLDIPEQHLHNIELLKFIKGEISTLNIK